MMGWTQRRDPRIIGSPASGQNRTDGCVCVMTPSSDA
eukprot:CAMPEP_0185553004 /NCGR_PEP_ID=MMETSP1381-20130426/36118_1 /TAXON_ID=298111 /ORGANISM="Pavlova sp., Strain CCMP459" /LENGTH=36 /DNA_ID= /DNA_START= /DNA_END= /DNA_ORIENTATION=